MSMAGTRERGARRRVIVVGSGIAGLTSALRASEFADVTLVTKSDLEQSNTLYAQGGIAAALFEDDSPGLHLADTLRAGAGLCDEDVARILVSEGPARVRELIGLGVAFDREGDALARGLEAAHSRARVLHAGGDATGRAIELALAARVRASGVRVIEHAMLTDLAKDRGGVSGVHLIVGDAGDTTAGEAVMLGADAVILATGGAGRLYEHTTNPQVATGDGVAAAWRAGAELADLEFYQFHPTALAIPGGSLVSEAVRGEGAVLLNDAGERFMKAVHPDAELAPRDIVARAIASEMARQSGAPVLLDATHLGADLLAARFPTIQALTRAAGFDWAREPIPVTPAAHYWMGGVRTDAWARASLPGLYVVGEAACTGAQGANRLASNSLLEGLVFAARAVEALRGEDVTRAPADGAAEATPVVDSRAPARQASRRAGGPELGELVRETMWRHVGVERDGDGLRCALARLDELALAAPEPRTAREHEDRNLLTLGILLTRAALARHESRGAHYRSDAPYPAEVARHSVIALHSVSTTRPISTSAAPPDRVAARDDDPNTAREGRARKAAVAC